jgi:Ser/Thr protein kinase RdoA (MazF antagonist)
MSPTHVSYAEYPLDWANKTKYMRENLFLLVDLLRGYEKERQPTVNELEALRIIRRMRRRFHRQRWHIAHFLDLVEEEIGEERVRELILESSDTAERMATAAVEHETLGVDLPDDPFWV